MKFIVDAQLPRSLSDFLKSSGFDSIHTLELPEMNRTGDGSIAELLLCLKQKASNTSLYENRLPQCVSF